jgi:hypothetical protein
MHRIVTTIGCTEFAVDATVSFTAMGIVMLLLSCRYADMMMMITHAGVVSLSLSLPSPSSSLSTSLDKDECCTRISGTDTRRNESE